MTISRRDLLAGTAGLAGVSAFGGMPNLAFAQAEPQFKPEPGASLRVLRWSAFVKGDEEAWLANTKRFTEKFGVEVKVDKESWEDIRPKAAVAAMSAPARTSCSSGSMMPTNIRTSCST